MCMCFFTTQCLSFDWSVHCIGFNIASYHRILTLLTVYDLPHTCPDLFLSGLLSDIVVPEEPELSSVVGGALRILLFRQSHQRLGKMAAAPIKELGRHRGRLETFGFFLLLFVNLRNCLFWTYLTLYTGTMYYNINYNTQRVNIAYYKKWYIHV